MKLKNFFPNYIGQNAVIGELNEILTLESEGKPFPLKPLFFEGFAGLGKTTIAELIAKARAEIHGADHNFVAVPSGTTRPQLVKMLSNFAAGKVATLFFDESHDLDKRLRNMLKPILETGGECKDVRLTDECLFPANPFQHFYIFASNEECKDTALFGPTGRTKSLRFVAYSPADKAAIIRQKLSRNELTIAADALEYLEKRVWPNARAIGEMTDDIAKKAEFYSDNGKLSLAFAKAYCAGEFSHVAPDERETVARFPRGLSYRDIKTLRYLNGDVKGKLVSDVAHHCDGETMKNASYRLQWLSSLQLTQTLANGRKALASGGAEYLKAYEEAKKRADGAKKGAETKAKKAAPVASK